MRLVMRVTQEILDLKCDNELGYSEDTFEANGQVRTITYHADHVVLQTYDGIEVFTVGDYVPVNEVHR